MQKIYKRNEGLLYISYTVQQTARRLVFPLRSRTDKQSLEKAAQDRSQLNQFPSFQILLRRRTSETRNPRTTDFFLPNLVSPLAGHSPKVVRPDINPNQADEGSALIPSERTSCQGIWKEPSGPNQVTARELRDRGLGVEFPSLPLGIARNQ